MEEEQIKDLISQLTVRLNVIGTKEDGTTAIEKGTGILLLQGNKAYILTVYHCIYGEKEPFHKISNESITFSFIPSICTKKINPINIVPLKQNLVLMEIDFDYLDKTDMKCLYLDRVYEEKQYHLRVFPKSEVHNFEAKCNDRDFDDTTFKIDVDKLTADTFGESAATYIEGLSGSGVFFSENNQLYLVGLVNSLRDKHGRFDSVHCTKMIDLNLSDIQISNFYTINDISSKLKEINKRVSDESCQELQNDDTVNYSNLNKKHKNIFHSNEVNEKNFKAIQNYLEGKNAIGQIKLLNDSFENNLGLFITEILENIETYISQYISSKQEGRANLSLIRTKVLESINTDLKLIKQERYVTSKLQEYIVVGWLLNCNVDFILEDD
ncbi:MAG: hypothetical protein U9R16_04530 [Campylobacterota bacterium]|nr:hypothetical protein [Campylobacterota bacterium]